MSFLTNGFGKISKKNYNYLIGDEFKFEGTVHAGGISYSGADIKVVFTLNQQEKALQEQWQNQINEERETLDQTQNDLIEYQDAAIKRYHAAKKGTQEEAYAQKDFQGSMKDLQTIEDTRRALDDRETRDHAKTKSKTPTRVLAEAQTISISVFREKVGVRALGTTYPRGFTRGPRQIGGSIIFTVFDKDVFYEFLDAHPSDFDGNVNTSAIMDQLPPVDIIIAFASELGSVSRMALYGVEFISNGQIMSIEDLITENTVQYVARDFDPMTNVGIADLKKSSGDTIIWHSKTASDLIYEDDYDKVRGAVDPFIRFQRRRTSFL